MGVYKKTEKKVKTNFLFVDDLKDGESRIFETAGDKEMKSKDGKYDLKYIILLGSENGNPVEYLLSVWNCTFLEDIDTTTAKRVNVCRNKGIIELSLAK